MPNDFKIEQPTTANIQIVIIKLVKTFSTFSLQKKNGGKDVVQYMSKLSK